MAAPTSGPRGDAPSQGMIPAAWPAQAADAIVDTIGKVRDKTTRPAITAVRALVYGIIIVTAVLIIVVVGLAFAGRVMEVIPGPIYWVYLGLGALLSLAGLVLLSKANRPPAAD